MALILPLLAAAVLYQSCQAHAQQTSGGAVTPPCTSPCSLTSVAHGADAGEQLSRTLAITLLAESDGNRVDNAAILHVLDKRARKAGVSIDEMARSYSSIWRLAPTPRALWVRAINETCTQPDYWPSTLKWSAYAPRCIGAFEDVASFLRGELANPAPTAWHWGGAMDSVPARHKRITINAANAFYSRAR